MLKNRIKALERASPQDIPHVIIIRHGEDDAALIAAKATHGDNLIIVRILRATRQQLVTA